MDQTQNTTERISDFPQEVLGKILSYLDKSHLLNSRLVCHSWNQEALVQLKKSEFRQTLTENNIEKFITFANASSTKAKAQMVCPFHLYFYIGRDQGQGQGHRHENGVADTLLELEGLICALESLYSLFEPDCVRSLDFCVSPKTLQQLSAVIKILAMIAPFLQGLTLRPFMLMQSLDVDTLNELIKPCDSDSDTDRDLSFPRLKKLSLKKMRFHKPGSDSRLAQLSFCSYLIRACPLLETLRLPYRVNFAELEINPDILSRLKSIDLQDSVLVDLIESALGGLPSLRALEIRSFWRTDFPEYSRVLESLSSVSADVESLNIELTGRRVLIMDGFPVFPRLKKLQIQSTSNGFPDFVNSDIFPAVSSIAVNVDLVGLITKSNICGYMNSPMQRMPNVLHVTLRLKGQGQGQVGSSAPFQRYFDHLTARFPSAEKLVLINESYDEKIFKYLLRGLIKSEGAKNFKQIEIEDLDENYLGQILEQSMVFPCLRIILENMPRNPSLEETISKAIQNLEIELADFPVHVSCSSVRIEEESDENERTIIQAVPEQIINQLTSIKKVTLRLWGLQKSKCMQERVKKLAAPECLNRERNILREGKPAPLNLLSLARNLPNLEEINISALMFASDEAPEAQIKEIQSVKAEFPNLRVNRILV